MKTAQYLYDMETKKLAAMAYEDALREKVKAAREVMKKCAENARKVIGDQEKYDYEKQRYLDAQKAVDFNLTLLKELVNE